MDPRMYPIGSEAIPAGDIVTIPTTSDKIILMRGGNAIKAITIANLFANPPDTGGTTPSQLTVDGLFLSATTITSGGAQTISTDVSLVLLNKTTPKIEATIAAPAAGRLLVIVQIDGGTAAHTVTLGAGTYTGGGTVATFNAQNECLVLFGVSATYFAIVENIGTVGLA